MEEMSEKISRLLSSPEAMDNIRRAMENMGLGTPPPTGNALSVPPSGDPALLAGLGDLMQEDDTTRLLKALRPFLHGERAQRLEEALRLAKLMRLLPLLEGGLFRG